jgi:hypothetical protein
MPVPSPFVNHSAKMACGALDVVVGPDARFTEQRSRSVVSQWNTRQSRRGGLVAGEAERRER